MSWFRTARRAAPIALLTALIAAPVCAANAPAAPPDGVYAFTVNRAGQKSGDSTVTVKRIGASITVHELETFVGITDTVDETLEPNDLQPTSYLSSFPLTSEVGITAHLAFYSGGAKETVDGVSGETDFQLESGTTRLVVVDGAMMAGFLFLPAQVKALSLSSFTTLSPSRADTYACSVDSAAKPTRPDALPQTDVSITVNGTSPAGNVRFIEWYDRQTMIVDEVDVPAEQVTIARTRGTH
jgi:hypothetical protein